MPLNLSAPHHDKVPPVRHDRVRLTVLLVRKQGMSIEEFHKYWRETHAALFTSLDVVKRNLVKYEQSHTNPEVAVQVAKMGGGPEQPVFDGMATFEAVTWDKLFEVFQDKEYLEIVVPDEKIFLEKDKCVGVPLNVVSVIDDPS